MTERWKNYPKTKGGTIIFSKNEGNEEINKNDFYDERLYEKKYYSVTKTE